MNAHRKSLEIQLRRAIESGDDDGAVQIAIELSTLVGAPREDDRRPEPIQCWGTDAE